MKIGMSMFLWTTHVTPAHETLLRDIKATGFDGVEIPIFEGDPDHFARLGDLLDAIGLQRTAVSAMGDPAMNLIGDARARAAGVAHVRHVLDCAAAFGGGDAERPLAFHTWPLFGAWPYRRGNHPVRRVATRDRRSRGQAWRERGAGGAEPL